MYTSILSAFHIGWRDLNVGSWIARMQPREYTLRATGWVRLVSGLQFLISVYLLALWVVTYFGKAVRLASVRRIDPATHPPYRPAMERRRFLLTALAGPLVLPRADETQQAGKVYRIGFFTAEDAARRSRHPLAGASEAAECNDRARGQWSTATAKRR